MALDDDSFEGCDEARNRGVIFRRYGMHVEEAAAVIELDLTCWGQPGQRKADLLRDGAGWNAFSEGIAPQVAHQTSPGTFSIREKDRRDRDDFARGRTLVFNEKRIRLPRI